MPAPYDDGKDFTTLKMKPVFMHIYRMMRADMDESKVWRADKKGTSAYEIRNAVLAVARRWHANMDKDDTLKWHLKGDRTFIDYIASNQKEFIKNVNIAISAISVGDLQMADDRGTAGEIELSDKTVRSLESESYMPFRRGDLTDVNDTLGLEGGDDADADEPTKAATKDDDDDDADAAAMQMTQMRGDTVDKSIPLRNPETAKVGQMRGREGDMSKPLRNNVVAAIPESGMTQLAVSAAAYDMIRPANIGAAKYLKDMSNADVATYMLEDQATGQKTIYFGVKGTDSAYQLATDARMVMRRTVASTRFFASVQQQFIKVLKETDAQLYITCGHSLGGTSALELADDYNSIEPDVGANPPEVRAWAINPYLNSEFKMTNDQTIYSVAGDKCSGGDPEILRKNQRINIVDGDYVEGYTTGMFDVLGKHGIDIAIEQTRREYPTWTKTLLPSYKTPQSELKRMAALTGTKVGKNKSSQTSFKTRVDAAVKKDRVKMNKIRGMISKFQSDTVQLRALAKEAGITKLKNFSDEQLRDKLEVKLNRLGDPSDKKTYNQKRYEKIMAHKIPDDVPTLLGVKFKETAKPPGAIGWGRDITAYDKAAAEKARRDDMKTKAAFLRTRDITQFGFSPMKRRTATGPAATGTPAAAPAVPGMTPLVIPTVSIPPRGKAGATPIRTSIPAVMPEPQPEYMDGTEPYDRTSETLYETQTKAVGAVPSGVGVAQFLTKTSPLHDYMAIPPPLRPGVAALFLSRSETLAGYKADNPGSAERALQEFYGRTNISPSEIVELSVAIVNTYGSLWSVPADSDITQYEPVPTLQILACMLARYRLLLKNKTDRAKGVVGPSDTGDRFDMSGLSGLNDVELVAAVAGRKMLVQARVDVTADEIRGMLQSALPVPAAAGGTKTATGDDRVKSVSDGENQIDEAEASALVIHPVTDVTSQYQWADLKFVAPESRLAVPAFEFTFL